MSAVRSIAAVREVYAGVRDRALRLNPDQAAYVRSLWTAWDDTLAAFGDETVIDRPYLDYLALSATDERLDAASVLDWLDAYPSAIADRLPGGIFTDAIPAEDDPSTDRKLARVVWS